MNDIEDINSLLRSGNYNEAKTAIGEALELNPNSPDFLSLRGELHLRMFEMKQAEEILLKLLKQWPNHVEALNNFARLRIDQKKWKGALNLLRRILNHDNTCADALETLRFVDSENPGVRDVFKTELEITIAASFPRSGHNLLYQCLSQYFKKDFHYCEYYGHCKNVPCSDPKTNFHKNHDFDLTLFNDLAYNYIVQYRHPIEAIISRYKLAVAESAVQYGRNEWRAFLYLNMQYWKKFVTKWVIENDNPYTLYLNYADFVNAPHNKLKEIVKFLHPRRPVDIELIDEIVGRLDIHFRSDIKKFEFYDPVLFAEMEADVDDELNLSKLDCCFI